MSETIDGLTINYEEGGELIVKELDKVVLTRGAWTTILYRYTQLDKGTGAYGKDQYAIRRYQKRNGAYMQKSKFNISSSDQAQKIVEQLLKWIPIAQKAETGANKEADKKG